MQDLLDMLPDQSTRPGRRRSVLSTGRSVLMRGATSPAGCSAVLDELTLTYSIVERAADGETRLLRRHVPSLREARRWAAAYEERQRFAAAGRARTKRSRDIASRRETQGRRVLSEVTVA